MKIPMHRLSAELAPEKSEDGSRTANLKWYTGATVPRFSWDGKYLLTLSMKKEHVRTSRLFSGKAPLLNSHSDYDLSDVIGVVESADLDGNAKVRFSNRSEVDGIWQDVQDGIIRNASVGASIYKLKDITEKDAEGNEKTKSYLAVDWEPMEVSLVPIGADPNAGFSVEQSLVTEAEIVEASTTGADPARIEQGALNMDSNTPTNAGEQTRSNEEIVKQAAEQERASLIEAGRAAERARVQAINDTVQALKLRPSFADEHVRKGTDITTFRALAIDKKAEEPRGPVGSVVTPAEDPMLQEESDARRLSMVGALLERYEPNAWKFDKDGNTFTYDKKREQKIYDGSRPYMGLSLLDVAKECLETVGIRWKSKSKADIVKLAMATTSDFPYILADSANKTLRAGYDMYESQWKMIAARRTVADFKLAYELTLDQSSRLSQVKDHGEFERGVLVEGRESYKVLTYGKIIGITRQAIINDDLGAFTRVPMLLGQEVAMLEADTVFGIITTNGNLSDSVALFEKNTHLNYDDSAAAISVESIGTQRALMRKQTGPGGKVLNLVPKFLLVPVAVESVALQYTSPQFQPYNSASINPWAGTLQTIAEPRLDPSDANDWYMFADPYSPNGTVLIYAYLEGQEGPYTETKNGFEIDGVEVKIRHDFGAGAVDYRGAVKKAGA